MRRRKFLSLLTGWGAVAGTIGISGCGTVLHNERVGQPHSRDIDWKVAALNGLGLAFFFVPGVIAFAVDFYTGAIYLPAEFPENYPQGSAYQQPMQLSQQPIGEARRSLEARFCQSVQSSELHRVTVSRSQLIPEHIENVVSDQVGRRISLLDAATRISPLRQLDQFDQQRHRHHQDEDFGLTSRAFFARLVTGKPC